MPEGGQVMKSSMVILLLFVGVVVSDNCGTTLDLPPAEAVRIKLTDQYVELLGEDTMSAYTSADSLIRDSPAVVLYLVTVTPPAGRNALPIDTATVSALVTKRGNVKRAWIETCPNHYFKNAVLRAVVQWKFQPNLRNGMWTDTLLTIRVPLNTK
jgi:hypothetical protein